MTVLGGCKYWSLLGLTTMFALGAGTGCSFSAQASGDVNTASEADAEASAKLESTSEEPAESALPAEPAPAIQLKKGRLEYRGVINFEYDKAILRDDPATTETMAEFQKFLEGHPDVSLEIEGHTDSRGSDEYNLDLSERRAYAVRDRLIQFGIEESRLTAVGKGEGEPQVAESEGCKDGAAEDTTPCEETWATNRRVVFEVTGGEETIEQPPPPPPPPPEPESEEPPPPAKEVMACPWLFGGHLNGLGPNSLVMVAAATQPAICWLELSLGVGYGAGRFVADANGFEARGHFSRFTIPFRGRVWFMEQGHSLVADLGLGATHYRMQATSADATQGSYQYQRRTTPFLTSLAIGYGFRPEGPQPGYRFAAMLGGAFHPTRMGDSSSAVQGGFGAGAADALSTALDERTEDYTDPALFGEVSLGLLF
jgi:outer membrane protein OmpA-like peptidoglycan-associated protein